MKLDPVKLGLTLGILWGAAVFFGTLWLLITGSGGHTWKLLGNFYLGFSFTYWGSLIGLLWAFVDGFIGGWLAGTIYNWLLGLGGKGEVAEAAAEMEAS